MLGCRAIIGSRSWLKRWSFNGRSSPGNTGGVLLIVCVCPRIFDIPRGSPVCRRRFSVGVPSVGGYSQCGVGVSEGADSGYCRWLRLEGRNRVLVGWLCLFRLVGGVVYGKAFWFGCRK